ncbi:MarR family transcriptional regulator [Curtobacterium sp. RRHDQ10]|uniref:MarR family transcriptional regulator n=1 Tax=Curtobacterium phyllosphaerae TaxID=3413379 RepID=UPI003BF32C6E
MIENPIDESERAVDREVVAARLAVAVGRINRRARNSSEELSYGLVSALASIVRLGPIRPGDLARAEVITKPTTTRVLGELESRGFVQRADDPTDGRAFVVRATPAGVRAVSSARAERAGLVTELLADLDDEDIAAIAGALGALERVARVEEDPRSV